MKDTRDLQNSKKGINDQFYDPNNVSGRIDSKYTDSENFLIPRGDVFHIGQIYDTKPAHVMICKFCGGDKFTIAQGSHFTAVSCVTCQYEVCAHTG